MKGYLRLMVMKTLSDRKLSGYDLTKEIEKQTGTWKPSYGSIYPLLDKLLKERFVKVKAEGRKKIYYLTKEGKKNLSIIDNTKNILADKLIAHWKAFGKITDKKETEFMLEVFNSLKKGQIPFKELNPELHDFKTVIFDLYSKDKDTKKIKSIIREAIIKLRNIK